MKKIVTIFTLFVSFFFYGQFTDNFETYTLGSMSNQAPTLWNTWSGDYGNWSLNVSDTYAFSGTKSGYIQDAIYANNTYAILNLGNKTSGKWQLTFKMYVPAGNSAYFLGLNELSSTGGYQNSGATLNSVTLNTDGTGTYGTHSFTYPQGTWFDVVLYFNATNKSSRLTINGTVITPRVFLFDNATTVGGVNFYSHIATDNYYVDDFVFTELTGVPDTYVLPDANFEQALIDLGLDTNGLSGDILVTEAQAITSLDISNKNITSLEGIQHFTNLTSLNCSQNNITTLGMISANTALQTLNCSQNSIASLDVSANTALQTLNCSQNSITYLDVSANTALQTLNCDTNNLFDLILANGNNSGITTMNATNNTNLTCIVIDAAFTPPSTGWSKDTTANYNTSCTSCVVTIPDANFKNALVTNTNINTNGDTEIQCSEAASVLSLNVYGKNIANLTGIEAFTALTELSCSNNQLTSLDVSTNTALTELHCGQNQLTSLNISTNTALANLNCSDNQLTNLDVSTNTALDYFWCYNNQLTNLDVSTNTALTQLRCSNNQLTNLDVSTNTALTELHCGQNQLTSLDVSTNTALYYFRCSNNQLTNLDVSNAALTTLDCQYNQLTSLDVSTNTDLTGLDCDQNQLTSLDMSSNTALTALFCNDNQLTSLNLANGNNANMDIMRAHNNPSLVCIQHDSGFTPPAWNANIYVGWQKDTTANWGTNCALGTAAFNQSAFVAYPNPVKDILNLEYNVAITNVSVFNLLGQEVINQNIHTTTAQIDMTQLNAGAYIVNITVEDTIKTIKVVKE